MGALPPPLPPAEEPRPNSPAIPLLLAFLPAALVLTLVTLDPQKQTMTVLLVLAALATVGCCSISSFMLFKRRVRWAFVLAIGFMILNALIAFFCGCAAFLNNLDFR